jgi:hypothetical protein
MKKILVTIVLAAAITTGFAQRNQYPQQGNGPQQYPDYPQQNGNYSQYSSIVVDAATQSDLSVSVDNYQYQSNGNGNTINIDQLNAGNHNIVIYQWKRNIFGKRVQHVIYNSNLYLKPGFETTIYINAFGQVNISERQLYNNGNYGQGGYGNNGNGKGYGYGRNKHKHKKNKCDRDDDDRRYSNRNDDNNRRGNNRSDGDDDK